MLFFHLFFQIAKILVFIIYSAMITGTTNKLTDGLCSAFVNIYGKFQNVTRRERITRTRSQPRFCRYISMLVQQHYLQDFKQSVCNASLHSKSQILSSLILPVSKGHMLVTVTVLLGIDMYSKISSLQTVFQIILNFLNT